MSLLLPDSHIILFCSFTKPTGSPVSTDVIGAIKFDLGGSGTGRLLLQNDANLTKAAINVLETTIQNILDPPLDVIRVNITSITEDYLVTYIALVNLPPETTKEEAQEQVDQRIVESNDEFSEVLQDNLAAANVTECGSIPCSSLTNTTVNVVSRFVFSCRNSYHNITLRLPVSYIIISQSTLSPTAAPSKEVSYLLWYPLEYFPNI